MKPSIAGTVLLSLTIPILACGKKGPPLAPIIRVPAGATDFAARRIGDAVHVQLSIPGANTDGSRPADIESITVYGFTGTPLSNDDFVKRGTVVARFPVRRPPPPLPEGAGPNVRPLPATGPGLDQGALAVAVEELTDAVKTPILPKAPRRPPPPPPEPSEWVIATPLAGPPPDVPLARMYAAIGENRHGQKGPFSPRISVPLVPAPSPPPSPTLTYTAEAVTVTITPPPDARQHVQTPTVMPPPAPAAPPGTFATVIPPSAAGAAAPPSAAAARPAPAATPPVAAAAAAPENPADVAAAAPTKPLASRPISLASAASTYNVYEVPPPEEKTSREPAAAQAEAGSPSKEPTVAPLVKPLNPAPLTALTFKDPRVEFGSRRCYVVRTVDVYNTLSLESPPSPPQCVTLVDTFPPAAPRSLSAVASPGAISLIWDANADPDLAGYLVLRAEAPGETLQPLFAAPIRETNYQDRSAKPGVRYTYAVVAVDNAEKPNMSAESNRVTEAAR